MSILFNNSVFRLAGASSFGNRDARLPENKCCRCGHEAFREDGEYQSEYNLQRYIWYQSSKIGTPQYLCLSCVDRIHSPIRKCIYCNKEFTTGKQIIIHLKANHSPGNLVNT